MKHMFDYAMIKTEKKHSVTKADCCLLFGVLLCAFVLFLLFRHNCRPGGYAEISYDGVVIGRIPLSEPEEKYYIIGTDAPEAFGESPQASGAPGILEDSNVPENPQAAVREFTQAEWAAWQEEVLAPSGQKAGPGWQETGSDNWPQAGSAWTAWAGMGSYNICVCRDGEVQMIGSNCPDKICVHHSAVSMAGENIICLPHRIVIEIMGKEGAEWDGVVS